MDAPRRCPRCTSDEVIRILYGTPSPDLLEEAREPVGWPLAMMCFGPKRRSGCALHVPTSGAKKRRNRDLSSKPNHTLGSSQESRLFALPRSGAGIPRVEGMFCELRPNGVLGSSYAALCIAPLLCPDSVTVAGVGYLPIVPIGI